MQIDTLIIRSVAHARYMCRWNIEKNTSSKWLCECLKPALIQSFTFSILVYKFSSAWIHRAILEELSRQHRSKKISDSEEVKEREPGILQKQNKEGDGWENGGRAIVPSTLLKLLVKVKLLHSGKVPWTRKNGSWDPWGERKKITADEHQPAWKVGSWKPRGERNGVRALQYKVQGTTVCTYTTPTVSTVFHPSQDAKIPCKHGYIGYTDMAHMFRKISWPPFHSNSNEYLYCSHDKRIPKLYSFANNMNLGPIPPQLQVSNTETCMHIGALTYENMSNSMYSKLLEVASVNTFYHPFYPDVTHVRRNTRPYPAFPYWKRQKAGWGWEWGYVCLHLLVPPFLIHNVNFNNTPWLLYSNPTAGIVTGGGNVNLWCFANHVYLWLASRTVCLQQTCDKPATRCSLPSELDIK